MPKKLLCACVAALFVLGLSSSLAPRAVAQQAVMDEFYGNGVHSFYDRDFFQAMHNLSVAIDGGSRDPRAFYYRGLAKLRTGDTPGAHEDLQMGSALESADIDQFYPVARSLERVQGADRATLERYRAQARAQARQRQLRRDAVRYEQRRRDEQHVLRAVPVGPPPSPLGVAPATALEPVRPAPAAAAPVPAAAPPATVNPFGAPATPPPPADDPFAPADAPAAADDNPFGAAEEMPAAEPPAADASDDPFGAAEEAPADDDPFGAAAEMPADDAAASDDPFADDPN